MSNPDFNLLVTLDAVLAEGSVARAARRLKLSPSAMSRALARLRETTGDPLLVRAGRGLVPRPRALELRERVSALVQEAKAVLHPARGLDLQRLVRTFTIRSREGSIRREFRTGAHCPHRQGGGSRRAAPLRAEADRERSHEALEVESPGQDEEPPWRPARTHALAEFERARGVGTRPRPARTRGDRPSSRVAVPARGYRPMDRAQSAGLHARRSLSRARIESDQQIEVGSRHGSIVLIMGYGVKRTDTVQPCVFRYT